MQHFFFTLFQAVSLQLLSLFGILFLFGLPLSFLQEKTQTLYQRTVGWKGILWTAWIGTPIHELSHYIMAKLFRHKVTEISIFTPNEQTGGLGHVKHTFNPRSVYQTIGNFFIGIAPLIGGSLFLVLLLYFLVPEGKTIFAPLSAYGHSAIPLFASLKDTLFRLFVPENLRAWNFWVFLYVSFAVASHLAPSSEDRKGMWSGFAVIVILLILVNVFALLSHTNLTEYVATVERYLGIFSAIFLYALIISLLHFILAHLLLWPWRR